MSSEWVEPEWAMATIAFVDIRGFTAFADKATAREAAAFLTDFFEAAVPVFSAHGGHVSNLLGDGMMTTFGAAEPLPDHADRAVAAAGALLAAVETSLDERYRIGIGINSGLVLVGTMGAGHILGLGVVGDPVNVASRVEGATKEIGEPVLITDATRRLLDAGGPDLVSHGTIALRGKAKRIAVYGLARDSVTLPGRHARTSEPT